MFSKFAALIAALIFAAGCAKRQDPETRPIAVTLQNGGGTCLSDMSSQLSDFFDGKLTPDQVGAFWDCVSSDVKEFEDLTQGEGKNGAYAPEALRSFLQHYFIKNHPLTDGLLASLMQLKSVFLSGDAKWLTRDELDRLQSLLAILKDASLKIQPHTAVLFGKQTKASESEVRAASVALWEAANELGAWLGQQNQAYPLAQFTTFTNELEKWIENNGNPSKIVTNLQKASLILPEGKFILLGGDKSKVAGGEWVSLFDILGKGYYFYLATSYGFTGGNIDAGLNTTMFPESIGQVADILGQSAARHPNDEIPIADFQALFTQLEATNWLPSNVTANAMFKLFSWALQRPLLGGMSRAPTGLNVNHIAVLRGLINNWMSLLAANPSDNTPINQGFNQVLASSPSFTWDALGRIVFAPNPPVAWSPESRHRMIWNYAIVLWLKNAFVGNDGQSLTEAEAMVAGQEIVPLMQNFGWLMTTDKDRVGKRRFREADLFTLASNGDQAVDLNEATRLLAIAVSSYQTAHNWLAIANQTCGGHAVGCVRQLPLNTKLDVVNNMPHLLTVGRAWPAAQFINYFLDSEEGALGTNEAGQYSTVDLLETLQIMSYVETVLERFDNDPQSETFNLKEATVAYPLFGPTLTHLLNGLPAADAFPLFTFMLKYGDIPFTMEGGAVMFNHWIWFRDSDAKDPKLWKFEADRTSIMGILAQLSKL